MSNNNNNKYSTKNMAMAVLDTQFLRKHKYNNNNPLYSILLESYKLRDFIQKMDSKILIITTRNGSSGNKLAHTKLIKSK